MGNMPRVERYLPKEEVMGARGQWDCPNLGGGKGISVNI